MTVRGLSAELDRLGHPLLASGVTKVENGERRVDVGDLVALALALGVSPLTLLLPAEPGEVALTPEVRAGWRAAWRWAVGEAPLDGEWPKGESVKDWIEANRPFDLPWPAELAGQVRSRTGVPVTAEFYYRPDDDHVVGTVSIHAPDFYTAPEEGEGGERQ